MKSWRIVLFFVLIGVLAARGQSSLGRLDTLIGEALEAAEHAQALKHIQEGLTRLEKKLNAAQDSFYLKFWTYKAAVYLEMDDYVQGQTAALKSMEIARQGGWEQHLLYASVLQVNAIAAHRMDRFDEAERYYSQAVAIAGPFADEEPYLMATLYDNWAHLHAQRGELNEAEQLIKQALQSIETRKGKANLHYTTILNNLAILYRKSYKFAEAERAYKEIITLETELLGENNIESLVTLNNLAVLYASDPNYAPQAEATYLKLLHTLERNDARGSNHYLATLGNLGNLYQNTGRYEAAQAAYDKVLKLCAQLYGTKHSEYAEYLTYTATLHLRTGRYESAQKLLEQAKNIYQVVRSPNSPEYLELLNVYANLHFKQKDYRRALDILLLSLFYNTVGSQGQSPPAVFSDEFLQSISMDRIISKIHFIKAADLLLATAAARAEQSPRDQAFYGKACWKVLELLEDMENAFDLEENKLASLRYNNSVIDQGIRLSMDLYRSQKDPNYLYQAFSFAERDKATVLAHTIQSNQARSLVLPDSLNRQERALQQQVYQARRAILQAKDKDAVYQAHVRFNDAALRAADFEKTLEKTYPEYHKIKYARPAFSSVELQAALPENTLFVQFYISDSAVYIFGADRNHLQAHTATCSKEQLQTKVAALRQALSQYELVVQAPQAAAEMYNLYAHELYVLLLEPLLERFPQTEHLILVPDDFLAWIPFEVLLTEASGTPNFSDKSYLLRRYTLRYATSGSLLLESLRPGSGDRNNNGRLLAFAADYAPQDSTAYVLRSPLDRYYRSLLEDIPAVRKEVQRLEKEFAGQYFYGKQATEQAFRTRAADYSVLHLAMHGLLDKTNPILSRLVFTEDGDSLQDNFLYAYEITGMQLNADLVVLSACETGYGKVQAGEGVLSIGRAFQYAGVPALMYSLWEVNDIATSQVMTYFYQHLEAGNNKAQALRLAKLDYLSKSKGMAAHPIFWAAFVLNGNDDPVRLQSKSDGAWQTILLAGSGLLLVVLVVAMRSRFRKKA